MKRQVKSNVYWVGKVDWELKKFHGEEYSTHHGSSYNAYLLEEEKTVLIDSVWAPFAQEFVDNLAAETPLSRIDFIVANHGEVDHSGGLAALMERIPETPIYCTANCVKSLKGLYKKDWDFRVVKTGDSLDIGNGKQLVFVEMPMLHWPDSMATYLTGDNILFSNDAFGQHLASAGLFNDQVDACDLMEEAMKYYANILTPFASILKKKLAEVAALNLPIDLIAPSHGVIWRENPLQIVEKYAAWAEDYRENRITVLYDTMWNSTKLLAEAIAEGIALEDPTAIVKVGNIAKSDENDLITDVFRSRAVAVGSPTFYNHPLPSVSGFIQLMRVLKFKGKTAAAFGSFGWSGESADLIGKQLAEAGFAVLEDSLKHQWVPDEEGLARALEFGRRLARA